MKTGSGFGDYRPDGSRNNEQAPLLGTGHTFLPGVADDISQVTLAAGLLAWLAFVLSSATAIWPIFAGFLLAVELIGVGCGLAYLFWQGARQVPELSSALVACTLGLMASLALGFLAGHYIDCTSGYSYWAYDQHRQYANVWPTEPAAAHRDASAIVFADGARPDARLVGSYAGASGRYCVAPIVMGGSIEPEHGEIQYWAVGVDCCRRGEFWCGAASDASARSGMVVYNRTHLFSGMMNQDIDMYVQASQMVSAKFGAISAEHPIFLRWVKDLDAGRWAFLTKAQLTWFKFGLVAFFLSMLLGPASWLAAKPKLQGSRSRAARDDSAAA